MLETGERLEAVLFDFGGTLFMPQPAARQVELTARDLGLAMAPAECERLASLFLGVGMPGGPYPGSVPAALQDLYAQRDLRSQAHRAAYVGLMSTVGAPEGLVAAVYERIRAPAGWLAYSDAHSTVNSLIDMDVAIGLVSNIGFDLRPILTAHRLERLARHATLSFEEGITKPSPAIFQRALDRLGASPANTLMVGDHPVADAGGAALGMRTLILPMSPPGSEHGLERVLELVRRSS